MAQTAAAVQRQAGPVSEAAKSKIGELTETATKPALQETAQVLEPTAAEAAENLSRAAPKVAEKARDAGHSVTQGEKLQEGPLTPRSTIEQQSRGSATPHTSSDTPRGVVYSATPR